MDHIRKVEPRRSNGNRFQPLTLGKASFWEDVATDVSETCSPPTSATDFPPLSAHSAPHSSFPKVSLVQGEIDRINKRVFVDNFPPVGNGGSPRPRVHFSPNINVSSDKKLISQMDKHVFFFCFGEVFDGTGWFQG